MQKSNCLISLEETFQELTIVKSFEDLFIKINKYKKNHNTKSVHRLMAVWVNIRNNSLNQKDNLKK
jgi:hypothetical protein